MADLIETASWEAGIYQLEQNDPVLGGPPDLAQEEGFDNVPHQQLAKRTVWLKAQIEALQQTLDDVTNGAPGAMDTLNELAAALGDDPNFSATVLSALSVLSNGSGIVADASTVAGYEAARSSDGVTMINPTDANLAVSGTLQSEMEADGFVTLASYIRAIRGWKYVEAVGSDRSALLFSATTTTATTAIDPSAFVTLPSEVFAVQVRARAQNNGTGNSGHSIYINEMIRAMSTYAKSIENNSVTIPLSPTGEFDVRTSNLSPSGNENVRLEFEGYWVRG